MVQGTEAVVTVTLKYILGRLILFEGKCIATFHSCETGNATMGDSLATISPTLMSAAATKYLPLPSSYLNTEVQFPTILQHRQLLYEGASTEV